VSLAGQATLLAALGVILVIALERRFPYDAQPVLRKGFVTDLAWYTVFQGLVVGWLASLAIEALDAATGLSRLGLLRSVPLAGQVAFFVVSHDLYIYLFHRWQHTSPLLWRFHEIHHSVEELDWAASLRGHALEMLFNQVVEFAPMVLLGASPQVPVLKAAIGTVWGVWIHSNVDVHTGRLQWLLNGPEAHRWHHASDPDAQGRNFATKFAFWDRLFGTAFLPAGRKPRGYGLPGLDFPRSYARQQLFAFRSLVEAA
jgi:sterol desaturase/sphingolipid hydroxylase (fatty acid hydroxylase superfamily)